MLFSLFLIPPISSFLFIRCMVEEAESGEVAKQHRWK
jgi:hypothetical protein